MGEGHPDELRELGRRGLPRLDDARAELGDGLGALDHQGLLGELVTG
jgi:hypothetical protein